MKYCLSCKHYDIGVCLLNIPKEIANDWQGCKYYESINEIENLKPNTNNFCKNCKYYGVTDICRNLNNQIYSYKYPKIHPYMYCDYFEKKEKFSFKKFLFNLIKETK